jgi:hypothetical protein
MENRVREMNVLARVAQGINVTLQLDDILELIYAQTSQIIPSDDFLIVFNNSEIILWIAFFLLRIMNVCKILKINRSKDRLWNTR